MSRKFRVWLDSGANIHSMKEDVISLEELGYTNEEWDALTEDKQDDVMREVAFDRSDWGYMEIEE